MSQKTKSLQQYYKNLLHRGQEFFNQLARNIMQGPLKQDQTQLQVKLLKDHDLGQEMGKFKLDGDESLLQLTVNFHGDINIMTQLATLCPNLLLLQRQGEYEGQTVLHTAVSKQNLNAARAILAHPALKNPWFLLHAKATGPRFKETVMMGELPLSVAALTFNLEMVDLLISFGACLHATNTWGDTVFHSLIRFAALYPERLGSVETAMWALHQRILSSPVPAQHHHLTFPHVQVQPLSVWLVKNREGMTALQLTALLAQPSLFKIVLELKGIYCHLDKHDGLYDSLLYDVTEIDPVAYKQWHLENSRGAGRNKVSSEHVMGLPSPTHRYCPEICCCPSTDLGPPTSATFTGSRTLSVLELICETGQVQEAFHLLNTYVVRKILQSKWHHYCWWFAGWALFHIVFMILLTVYAIYKAKLIPLPETSGNNFTSDPSTVSPKADGTNGNAHKDFITSVAILNMPLAAVYVFWEIVRQWKGQPLKLMLIHHNGLYRLQLLVFALCLLADSIWYFAGPVNNHLLVLALLVGWWFTTFFLRPFRKFSFFTVMVQKIFLGDMLRFSSIIILELVAFSVAMYITYLPSPGGPPEEFGHLGATLLTMFKLMLGLNDVSILYQAPHPWVAIILYVLFALLTFVIMLNALIAMMSNTCSLVADNKDSQWQLQRLSIILLMESMLPSQRFTLNCGKHNFVAHYDLQQERMIQEVRFLFKVSCVQTSYSDGHAILKRQNTLQTKRFDSVHAGLAPLDQDQHLDLLTSLTQQCILQDADHVIGKGEGDYFADQSTYNKLLRQHPGKLSSVKRAQDPKVSQSASDRQQGHASDYTTLRQLISQTNHEASSYRWDSNKGQLQESQDQEGSLTKDITRLHHQEAFSKDDPEAATIFSSTENPTMPLQQTDKVEDIIPLNQKQKRHISDQGHKGQRLKLARATNLVPEYQKDQRTQVHPQAGHRKKPFVEAMPSSDNSPPGSDWQSKCTGSEANRGHQVQHRPSSPEVFTISDCHDGQLQGLDHHRTHSDTGIAVNPGT